MLHLDPRARYWPAGPSVGVSSTSGARAEDGEALGCVRWKGLVALPLCSTVVLPEDPISNAWMRSETSVACTPRRQSKHCGAAERPWSQGMCCSTLSPMLIAIAGQDDVARSVTLHPSYNPTCQLTGGGTYGQPRQPPGAATATPRLKAPFHEQPAQARCRPWGSHSQPARQRLPYTTRARPHKWSNQTTVVTAKQPPSPRRCQSKPVLAVHGGLERPPVEPGRPAGAVQGNPRVGGGQHPGAAPEPYGVAPVGVATKVDQECMGNGVPTTKGSGLSGNTAVGVEAVEAAATEVHALLSTWLSRQSGCDSLKQQLLDSSQLRLLSLRALRLGLHVEAAHPLLRLHVSQPPG